MITIELDEPVRGVCDCCGGATTTLTRFVYRDNDAFAVYYAAFSDNHPAREVALAVGLGGWGEGSTPADRRAFGLVLRESGDEYQVTVTDAKDSPWRHAEVLGRMLDRGEALAHPWIKDVFHVADHVVTGDPEIRAYFGGGAG